MMMIIGDDDDRGGNDEDDDSGDDDDSGNNDDGNNNDGDDDGNNDDDVPHPSLQLIDLYISSVVTNSSRCLCHVLSSVALTIAQLILITIVTR